LQVSLGSSDEFFASDKDGKLSSRDPSCQPGEKKAVPRLAEITRAMIRQKAHTVSGPFLQEDLLKRVDSKLESPKLERRRTFQLGQDILRPEKKSAITPLTEPSLLTRLDSTPKKIPFEEPTSSGKSDGKTVVSKIDQSRRKSLLVGAPQMRPSWPKIQILSTAREGLRSQGMQGITPPKELPQSQGNQEVASAMTTKYVDAGVQTELEGSFLPLPTQSIPVEAQTSYSYLPPQHVISIGSMQEFCRGQYRLGDALRTYV
jgi:hypothetical protein